MSEKTERPKRGAFPTPRDVLEKYPSFKPDLADDKSARDRGAPKEDKENETGETPSDDRSKKDRT